MTPLQGTLGLLQTFFELPADNNLHHDHLAVLAIDRELNVGAAGLHADLPDNFIGGVAHNVVFLVGQGLHGSHGNGVPGLDAHGIEVLDGADISFG